MDLQDTIINYICLILVKFDPLYVYMCACTYFFGGKTVTSFPKNMKLIN